jgi:hypothetical protein
VRVCTWLKLRTGTRTRSSTGCSLTRTREEDILRIVVIEEDVVKTLIEHYDTTIGADVVGILVTLLILIDNTKTIRLTRAQIVISKREVIGPTILPVGSLLEDVLLPVVTIVGNDVDVVTVCVFAVILAQILMDA